MKFKSTILNLMEYQRHFMSNESELYCYNEASGRKSTSYSDTYRKKMSAIAKREKELDEELNEVINDHILQHTQDNWILMNVEPVYKGVVRIIDSPGIPLLDRFIFFWKKEE